MSKLINLLGQKFGRWTVIKHAPNNKYSARMWLCKCQCQAGTIKAVREYDLIHAISKSCGCVQKEKARQQMIDMHTTHGYTKNRQRPRLYRVWCSMRERCFDCNNQAYHNYGGRGITVCDEWTSNFKAFYDWAMSHGYREKLSIDRIDNNGNYEPSNCRFISVKNQGNNRRTNRLITYNGKTQPLKQWCEELGLKYKKIWKRIKIFNWDIERALKTP